MVDAIEMVDIYGIVCVTMPTGDRTELLGLAEAFT